MSSVASAMRSEEFINPRLLFRLIIGGDFEKLKSEGYVARKDLSAIPINFPMNWRSEDNNLEFNLHAWRFLNAACSHYVKKQKNDVAKDVFDFYIATAKDWSHFLESKKSRYAWYDMSVGIRAIHIAFMKYLCNQHGGGDWEDESFVDYLAEKHMKWLYNQNNITQGNHAIYQIVGLRVLEFIYEKPATEYSQCNMSRLIDKAFDDNFVSTENSPFYHKYNIDIFDRVQPELFPELKWKLEKLFLHGPLITKWLTAPDGFFYRVGDTEGSGVKLSEKDIEKEDLINDTIVYKDYNRSGYQVVRSYPNVKLENSYSMLFRGGPSSYVHSHCDALSFTFFNNGEEIFSDPGKFTYEKGKERDWFVSDLAHCTAGLKNNAFFPKDVESNGGELLPIMLYDEGCYLSGRIVKGQSFYHNRGIFFHPKKNLIVTDMCHSNRDEFIEIRYILGRGVSYTGGISGLVKTKSGFEYKVKFSGDVVKVDSFKVEDESAWVSEKYKEKEPVAAVIVQCSKNNAMVKMTMELS